MSITAITTGEQSVTAAGAITGSLNTSALTGSYTVFLRVRGLTSAQNISIALEDTANVTPFSDARQVWVVSVSGVSQPEGATHSVQSYEIPATRFGATNTALRFNAISVTGSPTALVDGWISQ